MSELLQEHIRLIHAVNKPRSMGGPNDSDADSALRQIRNIINELCDVVELPEDTVVLYPKREAIMPYKPSHNPVIARFDVNDLPVGWYWFRKPDGEPYGPYETEADAVEAAREITAELAELEPSYRAIDEWLEKQSFID